MFFYKASRAANKPITWLDHGMIVVFCYILGVCLIVFGMWIAIDGIIASFHALGGPFDCHCQDIWIDGCPAY
jgi:hypothetical protein